MTPTYHATNTLSTAKLMFQKPLEKLNNSPKMVRKTANTLLLDFTTGGTKLLLKILKKLKNGFIKLYNKIPQKHTGYQEIYTMKIEEKLAKISKKPSNIMKLPPPQEMQKLPTHQDKCMMMEKDNHQTKNPPLNVSKNLLNQVITVVYTTQLFTTKKDTVDYLNPTKKHLNIIY